MEMNTLFLFFGEWFLQKAETVRKAAFFFQQRGLQKGEVTFFLYNTCRFAGVSLAGMASQHRTVIHQIGTDVAQSY